MIILYFTATGNSLSVAKSVGGTIKSIPQLLHKSEFIIEDDVIGIVFPSYGMNLPRLVNRYFSKAQLKADYIFAGITSAGMPGNTSGALNKLLIKNGSRLDYAKDFNMMNNYLPWSKMEDETKKLQKKNVDGQIKDFMMDISARKLYLPNKSIVLKIASFMSDLSKSEKSNASVDNADRDFTVDNTCNGCKTCAKVCPVDNIVMDGKPNFQHHCETCYACIHNCPKNSIHLKKEKSTIRFRNDTVTLKEIIDANSKV